MAELQSSNIRGLTLSAATVDTSSVGNIWYNNTINRLQYSFIGGMWSSGGAMITARQGLAAAGYSTT